MTYKFLDHVGDVKFRAEGMTLVELFSSAADALAVSMRGDLGIEGNVEKSFEVSGKDFEELLYNFLEEFLFLLDAENFLMARVKKINIEGFKLKCVVLGDDVKNYKFTNEVKAVTYSGMFVRKEDGKFVCEVVLDV